MTELPTVRWGILGTGMISSWFVEDLVIERPGAKINHIIQAIGSSSIEKGGNFVAKHCPHSSPTVHGSYEDLFNDDTVDMVYIGVPHAFHEKFCLDAINAGKAVFCEKPFTLNAKQAANVFEAAKEKGVYVQEAMWLRHRPLVHKLRSLIHEEKVIGEPFRMFADFGLDVDIRNLPSTSRYRSLDLGAGSLLDVGVYSITWAILTLDPHSPSKSEMPDILATQSFQGNIEVTSSVILKYASSGRQAIVTSTTNINHGPGIIARIDGDEGYIEIEGRGGSIPHSFTVYKKSHTDSGRKYAAGEKYDFPEVGLGFYHEADNAALDYIAGRTEGAIMPWEETIRVMRIMDEVRRQGGTRFPVD
ncbi:hypothetical protein FE257_003088 [Aspergillus nanangensis]|uniref:D-xylose 1-dehydrogenase (NADP(+), D-xylono-1,5-lactone-forming) n=1 Tax=Aspergillus nanangensis TaxID=2582783 RepID=A0AAD4CBY8_ASPNN|nr:hypothetical protein FE257_003088 [Aspergillus nanangensis]